MNALAKKLRVTPNARVRVLGAPDGYAAVLDPLPPGAALVDGAGGPADVVLAFVRDAADLARLTPDALAAVRRDGALWIAYPKGGAKAGTDLNRDRLHDALDAAHGWTGVSIVAVDERWSALRFRPHELVGT